MTKANIISTLIIILLVGGIVIGVKLNNNDSKDVSSSTGYSSNVEIVNGEQQITITAGAGYRPRVTMAQANMPTKIRIEGDNAYGCESAVRIPQLSYVKNLEPKGFDIVEIPSQSVGDTIRGTCAMGMYNFQIKFQ